MDGKLSYFCCGYLPDPRYLPEVYQDMNRSWDSHHSLVKSTETQILTSSASRLEQIMEQPSLSDDNPPQHRNLPAVYQDRIIYRDSHHSRTIIHQSSETYLQCTKTGLYTGTAITLGYYHSSETYLQCTKTGLYTGKASTLGYYHSSETYLQCTKTGLYTGTASTLGR